MAESSLHLTDDERTVLMICAEGESLAAIGRWEEPCDHLVEVGLLQRLDKFNNVITDAGRKAIGEANAVVDDNFAQSMIRAHNARVEYRSRGEEIANGLAVMAVEVAAQVAGNPVILLRKCLADVATRAIELLKEQGYE